MREPLDDGLRKHEITVWFSTIVMFLLGLNLPRSSTFLALVLVAGCWTCRRDIKFALGSPLVRVLISCLALFGISFSVRQLQLGYWEHNAQSIPDLVSYTIFPSACLLFGFSARQRCIGRSGVSAAAIAFAVGGLVYVLLALAITRHSWWSLADLASSGVTVPWSPHGQFSQNVRSVEQRAFPAVILLSCVPLLFAQRQFLWRLKILLCLVVGGMAFCALWLLDGRLFYVPLVLSLAPYVFMARQRFLRWLVIASSMICVVIGLRSQFLCDERFPMQLAFLKYIPSFPWGGRQISFDFKGCLPQQRFHFGPPPSDLHLPHNIFLDVINDVGIVPAFFLAVAALISLFVIVRVFLLTTRSRTWDPGQMLRFGLVAAMISQAMWQPFLYSDQLMFMLTFLLTGVMLAESRDAIYSNASRAVPLR